MSRHDETFERRTQAFRGLHDEVTKVLVDFAAQLTEAERSWFDFLIRAFRDRYDNWPRDFGLRSYLERLDAAADRSNHAPLLRLIGHVYLHVALDLPRVVADSFGHHAIPLDRAMNIFFRANHELRRVFVRTITDERFTGRYARLARLCGSLPLTSGVVRLLGERIIVLRMDAFVHGTYLADRQRRVTREEMLRRSFDQISTAVFNGPGDPIRWMDGLDTPWIVVDSFEGVLGVDAQTKLTLGPIGSGPPERPKLFDAE